MNEKDAKMKNDGKKSSEKTSLSINSSLSTEQQIMKG